MLILKKKHEDAFKVSEIQLLGSSILTQKVTNFVTFLAKIGDLRPNLYALHVVKPLL